VDKATILEENAVFVYKDMDITKPPIKDLPPLSEITLLVTYNQGDKVWTKIAMSDGQEGYILGSTQVYKIKEIVILEEQGADVYKSPSIESGVEKHLEHGSLVNLLGAVPKTSNGWVKIRDLAGREGFLLGNIKIQVRPSAQGEHQNLPKCLNCGKVTQWKIEPLFLPIHIGIALGLLCAFGGGLIYIILVGLQRANPANRSKICPNCGAQNMWTFVYNAE
jgi:hypothetical protein